MSPVDYNSWIESDKARKLVKSLPKDVILAEGLYHQIPQHEAV